MGGMFSSIMQGVSNTLGAVGTLADSTAQARNYSAQATAERYNAGLASINAKLSRYDAQKQETQAAEEAYQALGRQRAAMAQGGILSSATADSLQASAEGKSAGERRSILRQGEREALNYKIQEANARTSSSILKSNARSTKIRGVLGAAQNLMKTS